MKKVLCLALVVWLASVLPCRAEDEKPTAIAWNNDLDKAMEIAAKEKKPLIAYFTFDSCYWCKRLEKECLQNPDVIEQSKKFVWVKVDRDKTPNIPKEFHVSAYPSLLTLGDKKENVFRFQGFCSAKDFQARLDKALKNHELYKDGKEFNVPDPRPDKICDQGKVETLPAPSKRVPAGIAFLDDTLWLGFTTTDGSAKLYPCDPKTAKAKEPIELLDPFHHIATDGKLLYLLPMGWTAGKPILRFDPQTGKPDGTIVTEANKANKHHAATGIVWHDDKLYVLEGSKGTIHVVNPKDGTIEDTIKTTTGLVGLAHDGKNFIAAAQGKIVFIDPKSGDVAREVEVNYPIRCIGTKDGVLFLLEQPIFGFDVNHKPIQLWPKEGLLHQLKLDK